MIKKTLIVCSFLALLVAESVYFGRASMAGLLRVFAQRAFFRSDHRAAWALYHRALALGGDRETVETDLIELINFGLDQANAGVKVDLPLSPEEAIHLARKLTLRRLRETPYRAYDWSLASDMSMHEADRKRRATVLDLTTLSEDPLENLLPEERNAIAELEVASSLEPVNFLYHDLLMDLYTGFGDMQNASASCRRAVASFPYLDSHRYLWKQDVAPEILEAAIDGFEDALRQESLVPRAAILLEAGRLLSAHGQDARAEPYLLKALEESPESYDPYIEIAMIRLRRKDAAHALEVLQRASAIRPEDPWPDYYSGVAHRDLGQIDLAIVAFQAAREKSPDGVMFFHALGAALEAHGQVKEAERQFVAAANLNPDVAEAWSVLLEFHIRHGNLRGAQEACARLSRLNHGKGVTNNACDSLEKTLP